MFSEKQNEKTLFFRSVFRVSPGRRRPGYSYSQIDMFATTDRKIEHLVLLPGGTEAEAAGWSEAVLDYGLAFGGMLFRRTVAGINFANFTYVTIIRPRVWPADLTERITASNPEVVLDEIRVPTPEALKAVLNVRVYFGWRYGPQTEQDWSAIWPRGVCLAGLHGRADGELLVPDFSVVRSARMEAVKVTSHATMESVRALRDINPDIFIMVRPILAFEDHGVTRRISPAEFVEWTSRDVARLYEADSRIRYLEIHNEPNLRLEGLGASWQDGAEFGAWFLEVVRLYRRQFPEAKFGFPGLSPGPGMREPRRAEWQDFLDQATFAVLQADWIGVHCYWVNGEEMFDRELGFAWADYRQRFPEKLLFITEFGNPRDPKAVVGEQYARYYNRLRKVEGLGAAFSYVVSTSDRTESPRWAWRDESGNEVGIAEVVGRR